jgi:hypothetical protein
MPRMHQAAPSPMCLMLQISQMAAKRSERALDFASHNSFAPASRPAKLTQS